MIMTRAQHLANFTGDVLLLCQIFRKFTRDPPPFWALMDFKQPLNFKMSLLLFQGNRTSSNETHTETVASESHVSRNESGTEAMFASRVSFLVVCLLQLPAVIKFRRCGGRGRRGKRRRGEGGGGGEEEKERRRRRIGGDEEKKRRKRVTYNII